VLYHSVGEGLFAVWEIGFVPMPLDVEIAQPFGGVFN
jgi:hypothetical protein